MQFTGAPSVQVTENNYSQYVTNPPSSLSGFVVRADTGYCNKAMPFTAEGDLLNLFGKPTAYNYNDWYDCWNFSQYASTGYAVRPMNTSVKNAGIKITGSTFMSADASNMYNTDVAELTLKEYINASDKLSFFNRYVTSSQNLGVSVCSSSVNWNKPIANQFNGVVSYDGSTMSTINNIGGTNLASSKIKLNAGSTLISGSKFLLNGNKVATVKQTYVDGNILVNAPIVAGDISTYYGSVKTTGNVDTTGVTFTVIFDSSVRFNITKYNVFYIDDALFYVSNVSSDNDPVVTFTKIGTSTGHVTYSLVAGELNSNSDYYFFSLSSDYFDGSNYVVPNGTSTLKVENTFNFPVDAFLKLLNTSGVYSDPSEVYDGVTPQDEGNSTNVETFQVVAVDVVNNTITLDRGIGILGDGTSNNAHISVSSPLFKDVATNPTVLRGINLYSTVFDSSVIKSVTTNLIDVETNLNVNMAVESVVTYNQLFEYEPDWVNDEFVVITLQKNASKVFEIVDQTTASYKSNGRDYKNNNIFANEVFFYGSKYIYCKVTEDESLPKVETADISILEFKSDVGTGTNHQNIVYGNVYPIGFKNTVPFYDPNGYTKGDIQNAQNAYADSESFDVNLLIRHELDINGMSTISESRKDCYAIVAPTSDFVKLLVGKSPTEATTNLLNFYGSQTTYDGSSAAEAFTTFGTYSEIAGNLKYQYDKFNDVNRWMSVAGDVAGLYAQTDITNDPWWAAAGLERGKIKNCIKLAFNPSKTNKDKLYNNAINPIINIAGEGAGIKFGNKTATNKPSALDRANVRRLLLVIEKAVATAVKFALFDFNDQFTRNKLIGIIDPFLRNVKARRGVVLYDLVCDTSNNTDYIVERNGLVLDLGILPNKTAEYIGVNMNIFGNSVTFSESVGKKTA